MKNTTYLIAYSLLFILSSCNQESKVSEQTKSLESKPNEIIYPISQFKYPKSELFLGFYSGMEKDEFHNHAKVLVEKGVLSKHNVYDDPEWIITNYSFSLGKGSGSHFLQAEFIALDLPRPSSASYADMLIGKYTKYYLVSIKLDLGLGISNLHDLYSEKYNIKKLTDVFEKKVSKIGIHNLNYEPKSFMFKTVNSININELAKSNKVKMPNLLVDSKSRKLDLFEKQVYYKNNVDFSKFLNVDQLVILDSNAVLYYNKYWKWQIRDEYSVLKNITSLDSDEQFYFKIDYIDLIESQSKQLITYKNYIRQVEITYTTKKYYDDEIKKESSLPKPAKPNITRNLIDEI